MSEYLQKQVNRLKRRVVTLERSSAETDQALVGLITANNSNSQQLSVVTNDVAALYARIEEVMTEPLGRIETALTGISGDIQGLKTGQDQLTAINQDLRTQLADALAGQGPAVQQAVDAAVSAKQAEFDASIADQTARLNALADRTEALDAETPNAATPAEPTPTPAEPAPADTTTPAEPAPVDTTTPTEPAPAEPAPADTTTPPADTTPAEPAPATDANGNPVTGLP